MRSIFATLFLLITAISSPSYAQSGHGEGVENEQGPVGFLWPPDREWSDDKDNTPPCGSSAGPMSNRAPFPLLGGAVALIIADDAWEVKLRISHKDNPTSQSDFTDFLGTTITSLEPGHQCYRSPVLSRDVEAGDKATIQLEYSATDDNTRKPHYACADIVFVTTSSFDTSVPCFNVTSDDFQTKEEVEQNGKNAANANGRMSLTGYGLLVAAAAAFFA